jgi:hypothetical protein
VIATARDGPELAIAVGKGNESMANFELLDFASLQIFNGPQPLPVLICLIHHLNLPWPGQAKLFEPSSPRQFCG